LDALLDKRQKRPVLQEFCKERSESGKTGKKREALPVEYGKRSPSHGNGRKNYGGNGTPGGEETPEKMSVQETKKPPQDFPKKGGGGRGTPL